jgi:O-antigen ligase
VSYLLAGAIALIALILAPGLSFSFDVVPKLVVLLAAAAFASFPVRRSKFLWLMIAAIVWLAVSTALSARPGLSIYGSEWRRYGALAQGATLLIAWSITAQARKAEAMMRIVVAAGALTALYGIAQYFGWDPILPASAYRIGEGVWTIVRPPATLGYASYFATWLLFIVFFGVCAGGKLGKAAAALAVVAMALTGTRAAFVGLIAGAAVWLVWSGFRVPRRAIWAAVALFACGAGFYFSPAGQAMRSRTRWFQEDPWGGARLLLWRDSARMGFTRPVAGFGPETFTANFPHYESKELARSYPDFAHESPHNIFLDALTSQGIPGLLLMAAWCALGFRAAWRARARHPALAAGLASALAAGVVSQQFTVFTIPTAVIFFATIGLAVALDEEGVLEENAPGRRYVPFAFPLLFFAMRMALSDYELAASQRALGARDLPAAVSHYEASGDANDLWYSRSLAQFAGTAPTIPMRIEALQRAVAAGLRATVTSEGPFNAWYSLSQLRAAQGDAAGVESCLRSAIAAHPNWFKPHWLLAQLLQLEGRKDEARREAEKAADLDAGKHAEVSRTLQETKLK